MTAKPPLEGLRVIEFTHMVMGPTVGAVLAELGADVIKVEPPVGDATRQLPGSGAGYFAMYNRGKRSLAIDVKAPRGLELVRALIRDADVFIENFRSGAMDRMGLSYAALSAENPRLIYCSEKGFLPGPYAHRTALDEVAQMMGGLAYMTGPPGRPLRAGASVIDVAGGLFGVIGILAALEERHRTGVGRHVSSALFETTTFLVGQHMAQKAVTGQAAAPMPARVSAWAIYDVFETADDSRLFVGVVSETQWTEFCKAFGLADLAEDPTLATNRQRVAARVRLLPRIQKLFGSFTLAQLVERLERSGLPFAPVNRPEDLFEDPHLTASGGLLPVSLPDGTRTHLPALPLALDGDRLPSAGGLAKVGEHTVKILDALGVDVAEQAALRVAGVIAG
jgi:crotonobetainyl-CoA:carnitine CoA-transferase CaiB-like acyl-CoA transferase